MPSISDASNSDFDYVFIPKLSQVEIAVKKDATNREPEKSHEQKSTDEMEQVEAVVNKLSDEEWLKLLYSMIDKSLPTQKLKTVGHAVQSLLQTDVLKLTPTKASGRKNVIKEDSRFPFDNPKEQKWENPSMPTFLGNKYRK
jgi:ABC-type Na+ efflux pump permease subunit